MRFIPVLPIQTHTSANLRNHRKIAVFDGTRAIVGGHNIDDRFVGDKPDPNRFLDFSVLISGPLASGLNRVFLIDWSYAAKMTPSDFRKAFAHQPSPCGGSTIEVIVSGPDIERDPLWDFIITLVHECQSHITIVTPYFVPDEVLFRSLMVKAHAGRRVQLIMPEKSNHWMADMARNHYIRQLCSSGVEIMLYKKGMVHGKLFLVDGTKALIGSANIDNRSLFVNFEIGLVHTSPKDIALFQGWVDGLLPGCRPFQETTLAEKGSSHQFAEQLAHLLIPLL